MNSRKITVVLAIQTNTHLSRDKLISSDNLIKLMSKPKRRKRKVKMRNLSKKPKVNRIKARK